MTPLEKALYLACKAFVTSFDMDKQVGGEETPPEWVTEAMYTGPAAPHIEAHPTPTSNGIPICPRHGKEMRKGQYGYFCTTRESDPRFSNKSGYCNSKAK